MENRKSSCSMYRFIFWSSISLVVMMAMGEQNTSITTVVNVGVVLDLDNSLSTKVWLSCIKMAISDFYTSHPSSKTRMALNIKDSKTEVVDAAAAALDLIKNVKVEAIIGPKTSMQANFVIDLGEKSQVPIISFSATSPSLASLQSSYFFRAAQIDSSQVKAISAIIKAFGWRIAIPIYIENSYGEGVLPSLVDALQDVRVHIPYRSAIPPTATDDQLAEELYKLMTMQTRVFIVHMSPLVGFRLFAKADEIGMMKEGYVWIMTNGLTNHLRLINSSTIQTMQGALGLRTYVPKTQELIDFRTRWKRKFQQENPTLIDVELDVFGHWAYDAVYALALAVESVGTTNSLFRSTNATSIINSSSTDLETLRVSPRGRELSQALSSTSFRGIAGDFSFSGGQLQSSVFEVVNVNGEGARGIGFWSPQFGLTKDMSNNSSGDADNRAYSTSRSGIGTIIWPGDSTSIPKGWEIPTNSRRLRVGVPVKAGSPEYVKVVRDPVTNRTQVTGFCIDMFKAVLEGLPYAISYDFIPFAKPDGTSAGTYNDMVHQVFLGNFDALAAATTIRANRSLYVDFTLPYTDSGVVMVVPMIDTKSRNAWIFLQPLTWELWVTSFSTFLFIGFVIWVLEHRINEDFRGPPLYQVGTSIWFSFSTMVFAQREKVASNLGRFVVIVWIFVVLILTQSYTASLTSLLTLKQLQPTCRDINQLLKNKETVGYPKGSFVYDLLIEKGFDPSKIKAYTSPDECDQLLVNGSAKGGISAAIDETPNLKLFLAKYCTKYTMVGPIFKTDGFAFVFPKGSPLVPDVTRSILNVTEGDGMKNIENKWFGLKATCSVTNPMFSDSSRLGVNSFWGLFLISGLSSCLALIVFATSFFLRHKHTLSTDPSLSICRKSGVMFNAFDRKEIASHTFRNRNLARVEPLASPPCSMNSHPSPSSHYSDQTNIEDFAFFIGEETMVGITPYEGVVGGQHEDASEIL